MKMILLIASKYRWMRSLGNSHLQSLMKAWRLQTGHRIWFNPQYDAFDESEFPRDQF